MLIGWLDAWTRRAPLANPARAPARALPPSESRGPRSPPAAIERRRHRWRPRVRLCGRGDAGAEVRRAGAHSPKSGPARGKSGP
ncbi:MAG TPA: hypothetical protein DIT64_17755 [Verrucomicrobiales bacterium]|nr:hypothetical protein [Verrucomicrobiales bacterium]